MDKNGLNAQNIIFDEIEDFVFSAMPNVFKQRIFYLRRVSVADNNNYELYKMRTFPPRKMWIETIATQDWYVNAGKPTPPNAYTLNRYSDRYRLALKVDNSRHRILSDDPNYAAPISVDTVMIQYEASGWFFYLNNLWANTNPPDPNIWPPVNEYLVFFDTTYTYQDVYRVDGLTGTAADNYALRGVREDSQSTFDVRRTQDEHIVYVYRVNSISAYDASVWDNSDSTGNFSFDAQLIQQSGGAIVDNEDVLLSFTGSL